LNKKSTGSTESIQKTRNIGSSPLKVGTAQGAMNTVCINSSSQKISTSSTNVTPCNLVKATVNHKKLTDSRISWDALPSIFVGPGKEALQRRDAALSVAVEALQEASAAESVIRCLSMFADLRSSAKQEDPQPSVEQFLNLHAGLGQAASVADALAKTKYSENVSQDDKNSEISLLEACNISSDKRKSATSWIRAALAADLSQFTLLSKQAPTAGQKEAAKENSISNQVFLLLESSSKTPAVKSQISSSSSSPSKKVPTTSLQSPPSKGFGNPPYTPSEKKHPVLNDCESGETKSLSSSKLSKLTGITTRRSSHKTPTKTATGKILNKNGHELPPKGLPVMEWVRGKGLDETADLAKQLMWKAQNWFIKFMEGALDNCFQDLGGNGSDVHSGGTKLGVQPDNCQIAAMLSQLKRVNDWLDETGYQNEPPHSDKDKFADPELAKTLSTLRGKIYDFLLQHVESAALALGNQTFVVV
jgi:hypothetical protein